MYLADLQRGREPDVLFVSKKRLNIVQQTNLSEAADLVIEIISPESVARDTQQKLVEYESSGVAEYWLIDPLKQQVWFYYLSQTGQYQQILPTEADIFSSKVLPNFWLDVKWLWQESLPPLLAVVKELGLLD